MPHLPIFFDGHMSISICGYMAIAPCATNMDKQGFGVNTQILQEYMGENKIGSMEDYRTMAREFCHKLREQIKESYLTFHGTLKVLIWPYWKRKWQSVCKFFIRVLHSLLTTRWPSRMRLRSGWREGPHWTRGKASSTFSWMFSGCVCKLAY